MAAAATRLAVPRGFRAAGVAAGVKKKPGVLDMAMVTSETPCVAAAAAFTQNRFQAAPVLASKEILARLGNKGISSVIINSGCANACTSDRGLEDARRTQALMREVGAGESIVMSTGVIGPFLPMPKIEAGIRSLYSRLSTDGFPDAARAIMTTDTVPKLVSEQFDGIEGGKPFSVLGMAKGAGMIHPNIATMLSVIVTDANVTPDALQAAVRHASAHSFNAISVDGDSSTNDTVAVLANGLAGGAPLSQSSSAFPAFQASLQAIMTRLAKALVRDGEGATKFVTVRVNSARTAEEARTVANSICRSALFKTALFGQDANWGRVLCAVGYSGVPVEPHRVSLFFGEGEEGERELEIVRNGMPFDTNEERASQILKNTDISVRVELGQGEASATMWTCDFSIDYVKINADYRS